MSTPVYRIIRCDPIAENNYDVAITVDYKTNKMKFFQTRVTTTAQSELDIVTMAWAVLKPEVVVWMARVDADNYLAGSTFVPLDDGTLVLGSAN